MQAFILTRFSLFVTAEGFIALDSRRIKRWSDGTVWRVNGGKSQRRPSTTAASLPDDEVPRRSNTPLTWNVNIWMAHNRTDYHATKCRCQLCQVKWANGC